MDLQTQNDSGILRDLWTLITVTTAPANELECARLTATGIPSLLPCVLSASALLREGDTGWKLLLQCDGQELGEAEVGPVVPALDELLHRTVRQGEVLSISDARSVPPALRDFGVASLAVVPVRNLRVQFGVLLVGRAEPGDFSAEERFALLTLADHLTMSLESLRQQASLERYSKELQRHSGNLERLVEERTGKLRLSNERHRALLEIDTSLRGMTDIGELLHSIAPSMARILPFGCSSIVLLDERQDVFFEYSFAEARTPNGRAAERIPRTEESVFEHCSSQRDPIVRSYREGESRFQFSEDRVLYEQGYRALATVPLVARDRCLGALNVASPGTEDYSASDVEFLLLVASRLATAIDNAQAYQEVKRLRDQLEVDNVYLRHEIKSYHNLGEIIGRSPAFVRALDQVEAVAPTDATVLVLGETGTGKELIARAVHDHSRRRERPLIKLNCAALPSGLVESELFGHEKGAFTGALARKQGRFELADEGTLFLDEVGEISLDVQVKLLRVLQEGELERVGGNQTIRVDVRVIAATNRDLKRAMEEGTFRLDLYYRLSVFPIEIPPLRERPEDIPTLALYLAEKAAAKLGKPFTGIRGAALDRLQRYAWPGNVRELENLIERAVILCPDPELEIEDPSGPGSAPATYVQAFAKPSSGRKLADVERDHIEQILNDTGGRIEGAEGAAKILDINPSTLRNRMRKLGIRT